MSGDAHAACARERGGERRIAVLMEYDGTAYRGSQYQENGPTIQAELEGALKGLTGEDRRIAFAGRTDAGVHALGQVAAFDTRVRLDAAAFVRGLDHFLPPDIAVLAAREVDSRFDPRRDARSRLYRYRIAMRPVRPALDRERAWHVGRQLDVAAMARAARRLEGRHDFAAFAAPYEGRAERTLRRCEVTTAGSDLGVVMEAEAFLPHQVRRTVGPLVAVGSGRLHEDELVRLLDEARPSSAGPAAPACGLYLVSITYDGLAFGAGEGDGRDV
ncbi:MAG: tRNA pseudouridine(38-40) synthase TruA [Dehalococcoidia bacterium]|nr:tRNA pseudouridine(38-40) synthase TruA [Dehalococcoidia bacterium]